MPRDDYDDALEFWDELRRLLDERVEAVAFVVFKMKHGVDVQIDDLQTVYLTSSALTIYHAEGSQTLINARNVYGAYVSLKD